MPGIIEGASEGKGLGDQFLKHISRTAILIFLLDPFSYEDRSLVEQYKILVDEIKKYKKTLLEKDFFVVMNKIDSIPDEDRERLKKEFLKKNLKLKSKFRMVSGVSGEGMKELLFELWELVQKVHEKAPEPKKEKGVHEYKPTTLMDDSSFKVEKIKEVNAEHFEEFIHGLTIEPELKPKRLLFKVTGKRIEQIARMTNTSQEGAVNRIYDIFKKMGIHNALVRSGARTGDFVKVGPHVFEFHEQA